MGFISIKLTNQFGVICLELVGWHLKHTQVMFLLIIHLHHALLQWQWVGLNVEILEHNILGISLQRGKYGLSKIWLGDLFVCLF